MRRRAWQGRELPVEPEEWSLVPHANVSSEAGSKQRELLGRMQEAIKAALSPHQREVLLAVAVNGVPVDVIAERLTTTRGASKDHPRRAQEASRPPRRGGVGATANERR
jgi:RNA polymerase sigma-70 factor (ECF subfamily)